MAAAVTGDTGDERDETVAQRDDRNVAELVQELRVAGLGVQVLFGFLLSLPFTTRFTKLTAGQQNLYLACVTLAAVATILLIAPVAYHRMVFRQGMKERLVRFANVVSILGLTAVGGSVLTAVLLVTWYVGGALVGALITALAALMLCFLWFTVPLASRQNVALSPRRRAGGTGRR